MFVLLHYRQTSCPCHKLYSGPGEKTPSVPTTSLPDTTTKENLPNGTAKPISNGSAGGAPGPIGPKPRLGNGMFKPHLPGINMLPTRANQPHMFTAQNTLQLTSSIKDTSNGPLSFHQEATAACSFTSPGSLQAGQSEACSHQGKFIQLLCGPT